MKGTVTFDFEGVGKKVVTLEQHSKDAKKGRKINFWLGFIMGGLITATCIAFFV